MNNHFKTCLTLVSLIAFNSNSFGSDLMEKVLPFPQQRAHLFALKDISVDTGRGALKCNARAIRTNTLDNGYSHLAMFSAILEAPENCETAHFNMIRVSEVKDSKHRISIQLMNIIASKEEESLIDTFVSPKPIVIKKLKAIQAQTFDCFYKSPIVGKNIIFCQSDLGHITFEQK